MIYINFLGLQTVAKDESDVPIAIGKLIESFRIVSNKCGRGFEIEFLDYMLLGSVVP